MTGNRYELPMTQEQIGDATGLAAVHVNRTLQVLRTEGLITRDKRAIQIEDWKALSNVSYVVTFATERTQNPRGKGLPSPGPGPGPGPGPEVPRPRITNRGPDRNRGDRLGQRDGGGGSPRVSKA
jgi:hypothetical protein